MELYKDKIGKVWDPEEETELVQIRRLLMTGSRNSYLSG